MGREGGGEASPTLIENLHIYIHTYTHSYIPVYIHHVARRKSSPCKERYGCFNCFRAETLIGLGRGRLLGLFQ